MEKIDEKETRRKKRGVFFFSRLWGREVEVNEANANLLHCCALG